MQDILSFILKNLTTVPEDVKIEETDEAGTTNYIVTVNPADVGRIIGKEGKVIKAIRTIMRVIAIQRGVHVRVSVVSENDGYVGGAESAPAPQMENEVMVESTPVADTVAEAPVEEAAPESDTLSVEV